MGLKILIAEDDKHTRTILEHIFTKTPELKKYEPRLLIAKDGEEAFNLFKREKPNLVISDLLMPKMDGFALCSKIRELPEGKDVPLIITSAVYKETAVMRQLKKDLRAIFFAKPFQVREFVEGVERLLREGPSDETPTPEVQPIEGKPPVPTEGKLEEFTVPRLLLSLQEAEASGILFLVRGQLKKEIFFLNGKVVGCESNIRQESLGYYLVAKGILEEEKYRRIIEEAQKNKMPFLKMLIKAQILQENALINIATSLVKLRIVNSFRWSEGSYKFRNDLEFSEKLFKVKVDLFNLLLAGLKRIIDIDEASSWTKEHVNYRVRLNEKGRKYKAKVEHFFGNDIVGRLEGEGISIADLASEGQDFTSLGLELYILHILELVDMQEVQIPKSTSQQISSIFDDPVALESIKKSITTQTEEEEISLVFNPEDIKKDGEVILDFQHTPEEKKLLEELESFYVKLSTNDYFDLLGVPHNATEEEIERAYERLRNRFALEKYASFVSQEERMKLEEIHQALLDAKFTLSDPQKREEYLANVKRHEDSGVINAELYVQEAKGLIATEPEKAVELIKKAITLKPQQAEYHALLAYALYSAGESEAKVLEHIRKGEELDPDSIEVNLIAAEILEGEGKFDEAASRYEHVLELAPDNRKAFERLVDIYGAKGAWKLLERLHRKVLLKLGKRKKERFIEVAASLAELYETHLKDRDKAKASWELILSVDPTHLEASAALKRLTEGDAPPEHQLEEIRAKWLVNPQDPTPLLHGFRYARRHSPDAAYLYASAAATFGETSRDLLDFYETFRPRFLPRAWKRLCDVGWDLVRDPAEDPQIGAVLAPFAPQHYAMLFPKHVKANLTLISEDSLTEKLRAVISYGAHELCMDLPPMAVTSTGDSPSVQLTPKGPALVIPARYMDSELPSTALAARLFPHLALLTPEHRALEVLSVSEIFRLLQALVLHAGNRTSKDPILARHLKLFKEFPAQIMDTAVKQMRILSSKTQNINISMWVTAAKKTARNIGVVLSYDLEQSLEGLARDERLALLEYYLSQRHLELRKALGLSINVA